MIVPLKWLSEYVKLPARTSDLTDKLTSVGHMLDKLKVVDGETIVDLELRGNRADMFGLIGVAREIAAIFNSRLKLPPTSLLPKTDPKSLLVQAEQSAAGLVKRYIAIKLSVKVGPSPKWLTDRLTAYGIPSLNNVVDITNYVMVETSHPMHAFDFAKLNGHKLILRRAKSGEKFNTIQQGTTLTLTPDDLAISDDSSVQCLNIIGGFDTRVTEATQNIILETAVYDTASTRRTARRHKITTEGGSRHEKYQDPAELPFTLARAVYLLKEIASAKVESELSDYYPHPVTPKSIDFDFSEVARLTGCQVPNSDIKSIFTRLELQIINNKVTVPTFRTDIENTADLVEEIIRIYGYDSIPLTPISSATPIPQTYPSYSIQEKLRRHLISLGLNEVITLPIVSNRYAAPTSAKLINPPDPDAAVLRHSLLPSLSHHASRWLNLNQPRVAIFEIGKVFSKSKNRFTETLQLGLAIAGKDQTMRNLTGVLQKLSALLKTKIDPIIETYDNIYLAEINVDKLLLKLPSFVDYYSVVSQYPAIIEDVNVAYTGNYAATVEKLKKVSPLIRNIELIDKYETKLTLRITYHDPKKQLSSLDIIPIREKLLKVMPLS